MDSKMNDLFFSLDIGTRKVVGIVARKVEEKIQIVDMEIVEHKSRTMLDGQIHNIQEVVKVVTFIKQSLEKRLQISLREVGVAVAGRALKTIKSKAEEDIPLSREISPADVRNLELKAVSAILKDAEQDFGGNDYYCVGYSVIGYELDHAAIGDLVGHYGRQMAVSVIATFLPRVVLDSMISVLSKSELEITNLTLEPIAAMEVIIPPDVRRLNLVLLDIGAGTSDIALTKDGSVFAYGMVPEAGDEITEIICEKFILDFNTAENIKRRIFTEKTIAFKDILGREHTLESEAVLNAIKPRVRALAQALAEAIKGMNQKVPHAAILVGGGSLTPLLEAELSEAFPLSRANIGIRLPRLIENIEDKTGRMNGPEMVTPLGICVMSARSSGLKFMDLFVNEKRVHLLDIHQQLDVLAALVAAGVNKKKLFGRIGRALCVEVNNDLRIIRGKLGSPANILVNGEPAQLDTTVKNLDKIGFEEAVDGEDAQARVKDIICETILNFSVNGAEVQIRPVIKMNGFEVDLDAEVLDRASIECQEFVSARAVLKKSGVDTEKLQEREIVVRINKEPRVLSQSNFILKTNGQRITLDTKVHDGTALEFEADHYEFYRIRDIVEVPAPEEGTKVVLNGKECVIDSPRSRVFMNNQPVDADEFIIDRAEIVTRRRENIAPTVSQVLRFLALNPEEQRGKMLQITVNGQPAGFTTTLASGADITVNFVER